MKKKILALPLAMGVVPASSGKAYPQWEVQVSTITPGVRARAGS
ncbi:hypothetical protein [Nonomuraea rosea]